MEKRIDLGVLSVALALVAVIICSVCLIKINFTADKILSRMDSGIEIQMVPIHIPDPPLERLRSL